MSHGKANATISVCSRPTALDFTVGHASRQWQYRYYGVLLIGMAVASAGFIIDQAVHWTQPGSDSGGMTLAICGFAFSFWNLVIPFRHYEHYRKLVSQRPESFIAVTDDGIYIDSPGLQTRIAYALVQKLVESSRIFFLYSDRINYTMLSKRGFNEEQLRQFRELSQRKLQKTTPSNSLAPA